MSDVVRISQLSALDVVDLSANYFVVLDVADTTQSAEGSTKKVSGETLSDAIWGLSSLYISNDTTVNTNSANWQNTFTNFAPQSANNISTRTTVNTNSANWQNTFTTVSSFSATWAATYVRTTLDTGTNTITSPGSAATNGDSRIYMLKQPLSGAAGTITFNPIFVFPDGFIPNVSTTNGKTDLMEVTFDSVVSKWVVTKFIGGYSL